MLDIAVAYNKYRFLGHEFLTWLWFMIENDQQGLKQSDQDLLVLEIGNRVVLENREKENLETITIKGDDAGLEEGILAIKKGALITEINLVFKTSEQKWQFTIKGESLNLSSFKTPDTAPMESREDMEGAALEKVYLYDKAIQFLENTFKMFIHARVSDQWNKDVQPAIKQWILKESPK